MFYGNGTLECNLYALQILDKKRKKQPAKAAKYSPIKPKESVIQENKESTKLIQEKNKDENLRKYGHIYKEFFDRGGPETFESMSGEIFDFGRAYSSIHYLEYVIRLIAFIETLREWSETYKKVVYEGEDISRYQKIKRATPDWADMDAIKSIYKERIRMTNQDGDMYHVDHIIPIQHHLVCGLHVENNLQIIRELDNLSKHNHFQII